MVQTFLKKINLIQVIQEPLSLRYFNTHGFRSKILTLVWRCHHQLPWFLGKRHLLRVSQQSRLAANDKGNNEMIPGDVHRYTGIFIEENSGKPQLGDSPVKAVEPFISNGVPYLQMRSVGSHSTSGREKEGTKERRSSYILQYLLTI